MMPRGLLLIEEYLQGVGIPEDGFRGVLLNLAEGNMCIAFRLARRIAEVADALSDDDLISDPFHNMIVYCRRSFGRGVLLGTGEGE